jgi:hypothetical protein
MPRLRSVRMIRTAISPRFAMRACEQYDVERLRVFGSETGGP